MPLVALDADVPDLLDDASLGWGVVERSSRLVSSEDHGEVEGRLEDAADIVEGFVDLEAGTEVGDVDGLVVVEATDPPVEVADLGEEGAISVVCPVVASASVVVSVDLVVVTRPSVHGEAELEGDCPPGPLPESIFSVVDPAVAELVCGGAVRCFNRFC